METLLTVHRWEGIFTSGWWRGQTVHITQESQLYTLYDERPNSWMGVLRNTTLLLTTHWNLRPDVGILGRRRTVFFKTIWGLAHSFKVCCVLVWGSVNFVMLTVLDKYPMHQIHVVIIHKVSVNSLVHFSLLNEVHCLQERDIELQ